MKKTIRLTESNLIRLIKKIIKESTPNDLKIDDFKSIDSYKLVDSGNAIEYQLINDEFKIIFNVRFFKSPINNEYKIEVFSENEKNNKLGVDIVNDFDNSLVQNNPQLNEKSQIIDTSSEYIIDYLVNVDDFENVKITILDILTRYKFN